jgi:hypothetical protein
VPKQSSRAAWSKIARFFLLAGQMFSKCNIGIFIQSRVLQNNILLRNPGSHAATSHPLSYASLRARTCQESLNVSINALHVEYMAKKNRKKKGAKNERQPHNPLADKNIGGILIVQWILKSGGF